MRVLKGIIAKEKTKVLRSPIPQKTTRYGWPRLGQARSHPYKFHHFLLCFVSLYTRLMDLRLNFMVHSIQYTTG